MPSAHAATGPPFQSGRALFVSLLGPMAEDSISSLSEHPIYRFFAHYPQQLRPLVAQALTERCFSKVATFLERQKAYGVLVLDKDTVPILSPIFTTTQLMQHRIVLIDKLENGRKQQEKMFVIYFVSNTLEAMKKVAADFGWTEKTKEVANFQELKQQKDTSTCCIIGNAVSFPYRYKGLFLFTPIPLTKEADEFVTESRLRTLLPKVGPVSLNFDFIVQQNRFVSLQRPDGFLAAFGKERLSDENLKKLRKDYVGEISRKLWSFFATLKMGCPVIRHFSKSEICGGLAKQFLAEAKKAAIPEPEAGEPRVPVTLIIVDRSLDPLPLVCHSALFGPYMLDYLDLLEDESTSLQRGTALSAARAGKKVSAAVRTVDLSEASEAWVGLRYHHARIAMTSYKSIADAFKQLEPMDAKLMASGAANVVVPEHKIAVDYGDYQGRSVLIPKYGFGELSILVAPYTRLRASMENAVALIQSFVDHISKKGVLPYVLSMESELRSVLFEGRQLKDCRKLTIDGNTLDFKQAFGSFLGLEVEPALAARVVMFICLCLAAEAEKADSYFKSEFLTSKEPVANIMSLCRHEARWKQPANLDKFREAWTGFLEKEVFAGEKARAKARASAPFLSLQDFFRKSEPADKIARDENIAFGFVSAMECLLYALQKPVRPPIVDELFPVVEGYSFPVLERRRRGAAVHLDVHISGGASGGARYYPNTEEGKAFTRRMDQQQISEFRSREKVVVYCVGGVTPAEVAGMYRITGDDAVPLPCVLNEVFWRPNLGEFDALLLSDDIYAPSRFLQRLMLLQGEKFESVQEARAACKFE